MSGFQGHDRDFSRYNHMSTEKLEEILRADFELPDEEESDMEKVLYITEVIARRRAGQPTGRYANADDAWRSFVENYHPAEERGSFHQEEQIAGAPEAGIKRAKPRLWRTVLTRVASIVAAIALVAAAGTMTASTFGFDFWAWFTAERRKHSVLGNRISSIQEMTKKSLSNWLSYIHSCRIMGFQTTCCPPICRRDSRQILWNANRTPHLLSCSAISVKMMILSYLITPCIKTAK